MSSTTPTVPATMPASAAVSASSTPAATASASTGAGGASGNASSAGANTTKAAAPTTTSLSTAGAAVGGGIKKKEIVKKKKVRRKKPATPANALAAAAAKAQADLASLKATADARRNDPAWLTSSYEYAPRAKYTPSPFLERDLSIVEAALQQNQLTAQDVTPGALACLLEYARRHALELMADAQDYAHHSDRSEIQTSDLLLAVEMKKDEASMMAGSEPALLELSQQVNRRPLPPIPTHCYGGIVLPSAEHQLTSRTFDVVSSLHEQHRQTCVLHSTQPPKNTPSSPEHQQREDKLLLSQKKAARTSSSSPTPPSSSYGASRGRQIPVKLKTTTKQATEEGSQPIPAPSGEPASQTTTTTTPSTTATSTTSAATTAPSVAATTAGVTPLPPPAATTTAPVVTSTVQPSTTGDTESLKRKADAMI